MVLLFVVELGASRLGGPLQKYYDKNLNWWDPLAAQFIHYSWLVYAFSILYCTQFAVLGPH